MTELAPVSASPRREQAWRTSLGTLLVALPIPLLLAWFLYEQFQPQRVLMGFTGAALGCVGLVRFSRAAVRGRRDLVSAFLIAGGLTVCLSLLWNYAYLDFCQTFVGGSKEVFRVNFRRHFAPFYGKPAVSTWVAALPAIVLTLGIWAATWYWRPAKPLRRWGLPLIMAIQLAMIAALGASDLGIVPGRGKPAGSTERISGRSEGFRLFREDAEKFKSLPQLFRHYVERMGEMSWYGQHYPPGPAAVFVIERRLGIAPLGGWATAVLTALSTPFIYFAAKALSQRPLVANATVVAYVTATGGLLYPLLSVTPLVLLPGAVAVWAFVRGMKGPGAAVLLGGVLGVAMVAFALMSLSAAFFAAVLGLVWVGCLVGRVVRRSNLLLLAAAGTGAAFGCHWLLKHQTGFDLFACAAKAVEFHHAQMRSNGFEAFDAWFFRSTCNLLAFLLINLPLLGLFVATGLMWSRGDFREIGRLFCPAVVVVVLIAAGSGKFFAETERIWMLFLPAIAIAAGVELAREDRETDVRRAVALMTLFVVLQELIFVHGTT